MAQPRALPKTVDKSIARMVAMKRIATGSMSLAAGGVMFYVTLEHGTGMTPLIGVALLLLWGGGAWTLRDGLRLRKAL
jgi:hypothetical protein